MQSNDYRKVIGMPFCQEVFRRLRNNITIYDKTELSKSLGLSWPTISSNLKKLLDMGLIIVDARGVVTSIDPNYVANFAGIHISDKGINLSILNFSGKLIKSIEKSINPEEKHKIFGYLVYLLRKLDFSNINALSISSDEYYLDTMKKDMLHFYDDYLVFPKSYIEHEIPKTVKTYFTKTSIANSVKYMDLEIGTAKTTAIFTCIGTKVYLNLISNGTIIRKSSNFKNFNLIGKNPNKQEIFYKEIVLPVWEVLNPDKMVFLSSDVTWIARSFPEWKFMINLYQRSFNQNCASRMVAFNFHSSENAALYAMYNYYGWKY